MKHSVEIVKVIVKIEKIPMAHKEAILFNIREYRKIKGEEVYLRKEIPSFLHRGRGFGTVAKSHVYVFKNIDRLNDFMADVQKMDFGKFVWDKYDRGANITTFNNCRTKPFLFGRKQYDKFTNCPMVYVLIGIKKDREKMLNDARFFASSDSRTLRNHLDRKLEIINYSDKTSGSMLNSRKYSPKRHKLLKEQGKI